MNRTVTAYRFVRGRLVKYQRPITQEEAVKAKTTASGKGK